MGRIIEFLRENEPLIVDIYGMGFAILIAVGLIAMSIVL